jgi:predicted phosphodiesterase
MIAEGLLSKIYNLGTVAVVAGNHDRLSSNNKEDQDGGAADLICWSLGKMGYDIQFNSIVETFEAGNINFILNHGHHGLSKRPVEYVAYHYGKQGKFNLILEGHLHSRIQKVARVDTVSGDSISVRKIVVPSLFTGNSYSEQLGFSTTAGFLIVEDNGFGKPNVYDYSL